MSLEPGGGYFGNLNIVQLYEDSVDLGQVILVQTTSPLIILTVLIENEIQLPIIGKCILSYICDLSYMPECLRAFST